jgi:hypothetical protein
MKSVYSAVRTWSLSKEVCASSLSENKQRLFPYTGAIDRFLKLSVFTARYGLNSYTLQANFLRIRDEMDQDDLEDL